MRLAFPNKPVIPRRKIRLPVSRLTSVDVFCSAAVLGTIVFCIAILGVAYHFISKYW